MYKSWYSLSQSSLLIVRIFFSTFSTWWRDAYGFDPRILLCTVRKLFSFRTGVFVAAAIAAVCSDTGCHNCQMRLPSSLQNWDVDVTLKEQTPAPPIFPRWVSKARVFGVKRKLGGWGWDSRHTKFFFRQKTCFSWSKPVPFRPFWGIFPTCTPMFLLRRWGGGSEA